MPEKMLRNQQRKGEVVRLDYSTQTYDKESSTPLQKGAWVYLPFGYTPEKQYNILYLLHGGGVSENWWFKMFPDTVTILDNMIADGVCDPLIIVTPTYYRGDSADQNADYVTENFWHELRNDLIPAAEKAYSTYACGDVSVKNLIATRSHRAFAGLSLGSMTTYRAALYNNFDLFSYYGPFSGCSGPFGDREKEITRIVMTLRTGYAKGLKLDYMLCCNGDQDIAYKEHKEIMDKVLERCDILRPGENYDMFVIPGGVHDMKAWQLHLYHALQIFFTK